MLLWQVISTKKWNIVRKFQHFSESIQMHISNPESPLTYFICFFVLLQGAGVDGRRAEGDWTNPAHRGVSPDLRPL